MRRSENFCPGPPTGVMLQFRERQDLVEVGVTQEQCCSGKMWAITQPVERKKTHSGLIWNDSTHAVHSLLLCHTIILGSISDKVHRCWPSSLLKRFPFNANGKQMRVSMPCLIKAFFTSKPSIRKLTLKMCYRSRVFTHLCARKMACKVSQGARLFLWPFNTMYFSEFGILTHQI